MRAVTEAQLIDAVRRGVITPAQYDALLALEPADVSAHFAPGLGVGELVAAAEMGTAREPPRGFNWITIAYYLGAITVMFAFGWFLLDRWKQLGPGGILAVALVYAALFIATGEYLRRAGYRVAGGLLTAVAVGMVPLITWAALDLLGFWPRTAQRPMREPFDRPFDYAGVAEAANWIVIEVATIGAALIAFRRLKFAFLLAPAAIAFVFLPRHIAELALREPLGRYTGAWMMLATGLALLTIAFTMDRHDTDRADHAYWPYLAGVVVTGFGVAELFERYSALRHLLPVVALLMITASLTLRRVILLAFGGVMLYAYLAWLAFDLFRASALFPIVLATLGLGIILGAVWIQRAYPRMVARVNAGLADPRPWLPAGYLTPVVVTLFALIMTFLSLPADRAHERRMVEAQRQMEAQLREGTVRQLTSSPERPRSPDSLTTPDRSR